MCLVRVSTMSDKLVASIALSVGIVFGYRGIRGGSTRYAPLPTLQSFQMLSISPWDAHPGRTSVLSSPILTLRGPIGLGIKHTT